jgi:hypothetical protein
VPSFRLGNAANSTAISTADAFGMFVVRCPAASSAILALNGIMAAPYQQ